MSMEHGFSSPCTCPICARNRDRQRLYMKNLSSDKKRMYKTNACISWLTRNGYDVRPIGGEQE